MCKLTDAIKSIISPKPPEPPGMERPSPGNWIRNDLLAEYLLDGYYRDKLFQLRLKKELMASELADVLTADPYATPLSVTDTGSMDPIIDIEGNAVGIWGANDEDHGRLVDHLGIGDIAVYQITNLVMHRIKSIILGGASRGFVFLGDNNQGIVDPVVVSESQIKYIVIQATY